MAGFLLLIAASDEARIEEAIRVPLGGDKSIVDEARSDGMDGMDVVAHIGELRGGSRGA